MARDNEGWRDKFLTAYSELGFGFVAYAEESCPRCDAVMIGVQGKFVFSKGYNYDCRFEKAGLSFRRSIPQETGFDEDTGDTVCATCFAKTRLGAGGKEEKAS